MPNQDILFRLKHKLWLRRLQNLRHMWLRLQGMKMGNHCQIGKIDINLPNAVFLGAHVSIENNVVFQYAGPERDGFAFEIGDHTFIGTHTQLNAQEKIQIGKNCMIAAGCRFVDNDHGFKDSCLPMNQQPTVTQAIILEDNVWIGTNVVILKGVRIGEGSIVGAGAVVTHSIPSNEIWGGVPARKIRNRFES